MPAKTIEFKEDDIARDKKEKDRLRLIDIQNGHDLLFSNDLNNALQGFDEEYFLSLIGSKLRVVSKKNVREQITLNDASPFFRNLIVSRVIANANGTASEKEYSVFDKWVERASRYKGLIFDPTQKYGQSLNEDGEQVWNTWKGWKWEADEQGSCQKFHDYLLKYPCNGNKAAYEYLLDWTAQMVKEPTRKISKAIAVRGPQGTGKSSYAEVIAGLFHEGQGFQEVNSVEQIAGGFNSHLQDKIFLSLEEAFFSGERKVSSQLKNIISSKRINITFKGKDTTEQNNYLRVYASTNSEWTAPKEKGDRRWVILNSCTEKMPVSVWTEMEHELKVLGGYKRLMWELMNRDISGCDWKSTPIFDEDAEKMAVEQSMSNDDQLAIWLLDSFREETDYTPWSKNSDLRPSEFYELYVQWAKATNRFHVMDSSLFNKRKAKYFNTDVVKDKETHSAIRKVRCSELFKNEIKARLESQIGYSL